MADDAEILARYLRGARDRRLLVVTGAGVSLASGIPTFRGTDPGAVWSRDVTELGTRRFFEADPAASWSWYLSRFERVLDAEPNPAHTALAALERWQLAGGGEFLLVTQNVDLLHERAGSQQLVKVHGSVDRVRCARDGCELGAPRGSLLRAQVDLGPFRREPVREHVPRCPACQSFLRQHVLWFDEAYGGHEDYRSEEVERYALRPNVVLCVGTSFSVGITELIFQAAARSGAPFLVVDPNGAPGLPQRFVTELRTSAEALLPATAARLNAS